MQNAAAMGGGEAGAELLGDLDGFVAGEASDAAQQGSEIFAVHKFHGEEKASVALPDVIHAADVGVGHLAGHADFGVELIAPALVFPMLGGKKFEGDSLPEFEIVGTVDFPHAAAPEQRDDAIAIRNHGAGGKPARRG